MKMSKICILYLAISKEFINAQCLCWIHINGTVFQRALKMNHHICCICTPNTVVQASNSQYSHAPVIKWQIKVIAPQPGPLMPVTTYLFHRHFSWSSVFFACFFFIFWRKKKTTEKMKYDPQNQTLSIKLLSLSDRMDDVQHFWPFHWDINELFQTGTLLSFRNSICCKNWVVSFNQNYIYQMARAIRLCSRLQTKTNWFI